MHVCACLYVHMQVQVHVHTRICMLCLATKAFMPATIQAEVKGDQEQTNQLHNLECKRTTQLMHCN